MKLAGLADVMISAAIWDRAACSTDAEISAHICRESVFSFLSGESSQVVAIRYDAWKVVFLENRGQAFEVWREPFTELRVPLLFNLRRDPFERAQHNANIYNDWFLERAFIIVPLQAMAGKFLMSMKDYPPSQSPGSFNLEKIQKQIEAAARGG